MSVAPMFRSLKLSRGFSTSAIRPNAQNDEFLVNILSQLENMATTIDSKKSAARTANRTKPAPSRHGIDIQNHGKTSPSPRVQATKPDATTISLPNHILGGLKKQHFRAPSDDRFGNDRSGNRSGDRYNNNRSGDNRTGNRFGARPGGKLANQRKGGSKSFGKKDNRPSFNKSGPVILDSLKFQEQTRLPFTPSVNPQQLLNQYPQTSYSIQSRMNRAVLQMKKLSSNGIRHAGTVNILNTSRDIGEIPTPAFVEAKYKHKKLIGEEKISEIIADTVLGRIPYLTVDSKAKKDQDSLLNIHITKTALESNPTIPFEMKKKVFEAGIGLKPASSLKA